MKTSRTTQYFYAAVSREISAHKKEIIFVFACIAFAKAASFSIPYFLKLVIDSLSSNTKYTPLQLSIVGFIICYSALQIASTFFNEIKEYLSAKFTHNAVVRIGERIFYRLLCMNMNFHIENKTGVIARDVDRGLKGIQSIFGILVYSVAPTVIELTLVTIYFYIFHDIIYLIILGCSLLTYLAYSIYATNQWAASRHEINQSDSNANQKLLESLINIETVKYFTTEDHELNEYRKNLEKYAQTSTNAQAVHSKLAVGQQLIIALCLGCTLWQASIEVANGSMTVGDVVLINALLLQVFMPLSFLGIIYKDIRQCIVDVERLATVVGEDYIENFNNNTEKINKNVEQGLFIEFNNVSFSYLDGRKIFDLISFKIPAGSTTAVVGTSGSGKSTIVKLILKAYEVNAGTIKINGSEIHSINTKSLRQAIGVIPQDISLFNGTIYYNIQYGNFESSHDEVIEAAKKARIHDFINSLKEGYQTIVGERGLKLSGGERQRVAIARALIKSPSLLIFDEATSALDTNTENEFQQKILESIRGKTILIIAHRLSTVIHADKILVFDKGKIVESGTHSDLMSLKGVYFKMWEKQSGQA